MAKCENRVLRAMQKIWWMDAHLFAQWMENFIAILERKNNLNLTKTHLVILDGHKSHVILEVIAKAKEHGVDVITLPNHTSHEL